MLEGIPGLSRADAVEARRTVNGQDKAALIAGYAADFDAALSAAGMSTA